MTPVPSNPVPVGAILLDQTFAKMTTLDLDIWTPNWFGEGNVMNDVRCYKANVAIEDKRLALTLAGPDSGALVNTDPAQVHPGFQFTYGYIEFRCTFTPNWCAGWTNGQDWPTTGEFDIAEVLGGHVTSGNYHYMGPDGPVADNGPVVPGAVGSAHTYGMYWSPGVVEFWAGGKQRRKILGHIVTGSPQYLIMNAGAGPDVGSKMTVEYVRVWSIP